MRKVEVLRAACCVAGADGIADEAERRILTALAKEVGVGQASLDAMIQRAVSESDYFATQFRVLKSDPMATMGLLFSVALCNADLSTRELEVLYRLAQRLDVSDKQFKQLRTKSIDYLRKQSTALNTT